MNLKSNGLIFQGEYCKLIIGCFPVIKVYKIKR